MGPVLPSSGGPLVPAFLSAVAERRADQEEHDHLRLDGPADPLGRQRGVCHVQHGGERAEPGGGGGAVRSPGQDQQLRILALGRLHWRGWQVGATAAVPAVPRNNSGWKAHLQEVNNTYIHYTYLFLSPFPLFIYYLFIYFSILSIPIYS